MNAFAQLLDRLAYEPSRNNKLRLIADYLRSTPDPERGYALAALTGALTFQHAKAGIIRTLLPVITAHHIATAAEVDIDTLEDRLRAASSQGAGVLAPLLVSASARTPA